MRKFKKVAVGGTFDQLHKGHKNLIEKALELGDRLVLGLTTDKMAKNKLKLHEVAQFEERREENTSTFS